MSRVHVDERKWPDQLHWQFFADRLGEDEHGVWLLVPSDTIAQRGEEPPRTVGAGFVLLVPAEEWWIAEFYWDHPWHSIYINIGTPPVWDGDRFTQIDLDLDVVLKLDGSIEVLDEDEFADHQVRFEYSPELIASTRAATEAAVGQLESGVEPFAQVARRWLQSAGHATAD